MLVPQLFEDPCVWARRGGGPGEEDPVLRSCWIGSLRRWPSQPGSSAEARGMRDRTRAQYARPGRSWPDCWVIPELWSPREQWQGHQAPDSWMRQPPDHQQAFAGVGRGSCRVRAPPAQSRPRLPAAVALHLAGPSPSRSPAWQILPWAMLLEAVGQAPSPLCSARLPMRGGHGRTGAAQGPCAHHAGQGRPMVGLRVPTAWASTEAAEHTPPPPPHHRHLIAPLPLPPHGSFIHRLRHSCSDTLVHPVSLRPARLLPLARPRLTNRDPLSLSAPCPSSALPRSSLAFSIQQASRQMLHRQRARRVWHRRPFLLARLCFPRPPWARTITCSS